MAAFIKSLTRFLSHAKPAPALHLAAFGKHPGWNDHTDDLGLDTDALVNAKRLLYIQGISQNIDSGAWDKLDPEPAPIVAQPSSASLTEPPPTTVVQPPSAVIDETASNAVSPILETPLAPSPSQNRLDLFRHDFLWHMAPLLLAGRLWSSVDGKGRDKYPMVLCAQLTELPDRFAGSVVLPFLSQVHEKCAAATTADAVRDILNTEREKLRARIKEAPSPEPLSPRQLAAVASHPDMHPNREGFHRIVYQFALGMSGFRAIGSSSTSSRILSRRAEQVRLPTCGMPPEDALLFWLRFSLSFLDPATSILLFAPDQGPAAPWVDLIAGEPAPNNLFCIKAGTKSLPFTSDIPYTLDPTFVATINDYVDTCATAPEDAPLPPWPV